MNLPRIPLRRTPKPERAGRFASGPDTAAPGASREFNFSIELTDDEKDRLSADELFVLALRKIVKLTQVDKQRFGPDELFVLAEQFPVSLHGFRVVGHDADDGGELARADLPDVKIRDDGIAVTLDCTANLVGQIG